MSGKKTRVSEEPQTLDPTMTHVWIEQWINQGFKAYERRLDALEKEVRVFRTAFFVCVACLGFLLIGLIFGVLL